MKIASSVTADANTVVPISPGAVGDVLPEFLEVPDVARLFGIRRTTLYGLMKTGAVKSILLRRPGCQTGKRLVVASSCREFLRGELEKQGGIYTPGICNAIQSGKTQPVEVSNGKGV